jgi:cytochrome c biogenesis protein CcmG, thiol:disulfide interchange protein DsbE
MIQEGETKEVTSGAGQKSKMARAVAGIALVISLLILVYILALRVASSSSSLPSAAPVASSQGKLAPDFKLALFNGEERSLAALRGSVVVVNIWASWCGPCRIEAPTLETVWQNYKDRGVAFLGVAVSDTTDDAKAFIRTFKLTYPNGLDADAAIARAYRVSAVPETIVVSKDGRVAKLFVGPVEQAKLEALLEQLLRT